MHNCVNASAIVKANSSELINMLNIKEENALAPSDLNQN